MILFLTICALYHAASIRIPDDTPKSTISKENDSFNILQRSKILLKYTDHLYDKQRNLTQELLHKNESLRWFWTCFPRVLKLSSCDWCMKIVLRKVSYREASIMICIVLWDMFVLRFYGPVNPIGSCWAQSVYLTIHLLGRLSPKRLTSIVHILLPETDNCPSWIRGRDDCIITALLLPS